MSKRTVRSKKLLSENQIDVALESESNRINKKQNIVKPSVLVDATKLIII